MKLIENVFGRATSWIVRSALLMAVLVVVSGSACPTSSTPSVALTPSDPFVQQGGSVTCDVGTSNAMSVGLSLVVGLPAGVSYSFNAATQQLTFTADNSAALGLKSVSLTFVTDLGEPILLDLNLTVVPPNTGVAFDPNAKTVEQGETAKTTAIFTGTPALDNFDSYTGADSSMILAFNSTTHELSVGTSASTPPGTYGISVKFKAADNTMFTAPFTVVVTSPSAITNVLDSDFPGTDWADVLFANNVSAAATSTDAGVGVSGASRKHTVEFTTTGDGIIADLLQRPNSFWDAGSDDVVSLDFHCQVKVEAPAVPATFNGIRVAVVQNGKVFVSDFGVSSTSAAAGWSNIDLSGLHATDFDEVGPNGPTLNVNSHPNFASGFLKFGIVSDWSGTGGPNPRTGEIHLDDFLVAIHH